jgi:hypothetical protein
VPKKPGGGEPSYRRPIPSSMAKIGAPGYNNRNRTRSVAEAIIQTSESVFGPPRRYDTKRKKKL